MNAWDRQAGESKNAYEAFAEYLRSSDRMLQTVANVLQKNPATVRRWATKFSWRERAAAWDSSILEADRVEQIRRRKKAITRQEELGNLLIDKAIEVLNTANTKKASFYAATQMAELGCRLVNELDDLKKRDDTESTLTINIKRAGA